MPRKRKISETESDDIEQATTTTTVTSPPSTKSPKRKRAKTVEETNKNESSSSNYIRCPTTMKNTNANSVFLAGGISGCGDWQVKIKELIHSKANDLILINPRRANFDVTNPSMTEEQIIWEHNHLSKSTAVLFYFPSETLCPITLYELGTWSQSLKPIFIACHPEYKRKIDVEIQTKLCRPEIVVVETLPELASQVVQWHRESSKTTNTSTQTPSKTPSKSTRSTPRKKNNH